MSKYLIVGLGNIGTEYVNTRHNIGFDVICDFVAKHGGKFKAERLARIAEVKFKGRQLICVCPTEFMNLSGRSFIYWLNIEKIPIENTLVVADDLSLPLEKIRLRKSGSHGGHNGLKDIQNALGTDDYPRLRFGIGSNFPIGMQSDFVLGKWRKDEMPIVQLKVEKCIEIIESFVTIGIDLTMTAFNNLSIKP